LVRPNNRYNIKSLTILDNHFIQDQTILINSALQSAAVTNPSLSVDAKNKVVYLDVAYSPQVSIISGSGSGHEPSFVGYVGRGMLAAAVSGGILSTPSQEQIGVALTKVDGKHGILAIIMNHQVSLFWVLP
jgi:dihydroxyacetone kinase